MFKIVSKKENVNMHVLFKPKSTATLTAKNSKQKCKPTEAYI